MEKKINSFVYWTPRILGIIFVAFLALFSLDVFEAGGSAGGIALGLFMHNIPALILLAVIIISWKHEIVGGIVFILAGISFIILNLIREAGTAIVDPWYITVAFSLIIAVPSFLIGILFLVNWRMKKKAA
ncbi:MAG: hypothetical protein V1702_04845 [Candidatus Woesearchaeota archaeon]